MRPTSSTLVYRLASGRQLALTRDKLQDISVSARAERCCSVAHQVDLYSISNIPQHLCTIHTHTHTQLLNGRLCRTTRVGQYQKKHSPTHTHPDHRTSSINFLHLLQSVVTVYVFDSPLWQPLSGSSLVFLLVWDPQLHTPYISSPSHHLLFATYSHTIAVFSAVIPMLCHLFLISLSALT